MKEAMKLLFCRVGIVGVNPQGIQRKLGVEREYFY